MPLITLTTDFGLADPFVAMMKGVILSIAPGCTIVDVSHEVPAGDVMAGALMLEAADYFPAGTIHVAVVDPGVGGQRKAIAVETDEAVFVGPDNGIFTLAMARKTVHRVVELTNPSYHHHPVPATEASAHPLAGTRRHR